MFTWVFRPYLADDAPLYRHGRRRPECINQLEWAPQGQLLATQLSNGVCVVRYRGRDDKPPSAAFAASMNRGPKSIAWDCRHSSPNLVVLRERDRVRAALKPTIENRLTTLQRQVQILRLDGSPSANYEQLPVPQGCSLEAVSTSATAADTPAHVLGAGEIQGFCDRHLAVCVWDERSCRKPALVLRAQHARDRLWETLSCACSISCNAIIAAGSTQGWVTLWDVRKARASTRAIMHLGVPRKVRIAVPPRARTRAKAHMAKLTSSRNMHRTMASCANGGFLRRRPRL